MHVTACLPACSGTMLFGESQDYAAACALLDACVDAGAPFFDSAEMYPVPQRAETQVCGSALDPPLVACVLRCWCLRRRAGSGSLRACGRALCLARVVVTCRMCVCDYAPLQGQSEEFLGRWMKRHCR